MKLTREQVEAMLADGRQMDSAILARELLAAWDREAKLRAAIRDYITAVGDAEGVAFIGFIKNDESRAIIAELDPIGGDTP